MGPQTPPGPIFGSLIRFHRADENSATEMSEVMQDLRALANAGATVIVLHHKPKAEGAHYRGSSDIAGAVDTAYSVARDRQAGILTLDCFKSRFVEEFSITMRPDLGDEGDFVVVDAPKVTTAREHADKLDQVIRNRPGQTQETVVAEAKKASVPIGKARAVLQEFAGTRWRVEKGPKNANLYF